MGTSAKVGRPRSGWWSVTSILTVPSSRRQQTSAAVPACTTALVTSSLTRTTASSTTSGSPQPSSASRTKARAAEADRPTGSKVAAARAVTTLPRLLCSGLAARGCGLDSRCVPAGGGGAGAGRWPGAALHPTFRLVPRGGGASKQAPEGDSAHPFRTGPVPTERNRSCTGRECCQTGGSAMSVRSSTVVVGSGGPEGPTGTFTGTVPGGGPRRGAAAGARTVHDLGGAR